MYLTLIVVIIAGILYALCRVAIEAPPSGNMTEWIDSMLGTFFKGEFTIMKKSIICIMAAAMMLVTCAYADESPEATELPEPEEELTDVLDVSETDEPVLLPAESDEAGDPAPADTGDSDSADDPADEGAESEPDVTPEPTDAPEPTEEPAPTPDVIMSLGDDESPEANETPAPTETPMTYEQETLTTLGNIYGILIFFTVVVLCFFAYKFFRIFF